MISNNKIVTRQAITPQDRCVLLLKKKNHSDPLMAHSSTPKCLQSDHALKMGFWLFCNQQTIQPNESLQPIQQIKNMNNVLMSVLLASTPNEFWWNEQREWMERMLPSNDMWREHWGDMTKGSKNFHGDSCMHKSNYCISWCIWALGLHDMLWQFGWLLS